jgi:hypothetical protein
MWKRERSLFHVVNGMGGLGQAFTGLCLRSVAAWLQGCLKGISSVGTPESYLRLEMDVSDDPLLPCGLCLEIWKTESAPE